MQGSARKRQKAAGSFRERQDAATSGAESARKRQGAAGSHEEQQDAAKSGGASMRRTIQGNIYITAYGRGVVAVASNPRFGLTGRLNPPSPVVRPGATLYESAKIVCG